MMAVCDFSTSVIIGLWVNIVLKKISLFIYISVDPWILILFHRLWYIIINFVPKLSHFVRGNLLKLSLVSFCHDEPQHSLRTPYFLTQNIVPGSSCVFPLQSIKQSFISSWNPSSFHEFCLIEINIWVIGMLIITGHCYSQNWEACIIYIYL